jgi:hypothetical protein
MATVQLSDIIDVTVFQDLPPVNDPTKTAFFESGVVTQNALLNNLANQPGKVAELPFWNDLDPADDPNLSDDVPGNEAVPKNVNQGEQISRKAFLNQGWSAADLAAEIAQGANAMEHIRARVDRYWTRQWQKRLIKACNGVMADNVANDSSDMVYDASGATNADITTTTVFTRQNFTTAAFTMGDAYDQLAAIAVHSVVYKRMVDNDDIDYIPDSEGELTIPTFLGHRIIIDDGMPYTPAGGTADVDPAPKYTSVIFGQGAFGFGNGTPPNPVAIERKESQGTGAGIETLWTRKTWILHPFGFQAAAVPAGNSYTLAELAAAATWDRVVARKLIPMAFLITNG